MHECISYDVTMRATVALSDQVYNRAKDLASQRGLSLSATLSNLVEVGLALEHPLDEVELKRDTDTGLLTFTIDDGQTITSDNVAQLIDED